VHCVTNVREYVTSIIDINLLEYKNKHDLYVNVWTRKQQVLELLVMLNQIICIAIEVVV
jgi:hypothetical protein